jgi:hypothetical protein
MHSSRDGYEVLGTGLAHSLEKGGRRGKRTAGMGRGEESSGRGVSGGRVVKRSRSSALEIMHSNGSFARPTSRYLISTAFHFPRCLKICLRFVLLCNISKPRDMCSLRSCRPRSRRARLCRKNRAEDFFFEGGDGDWRLVATGRQYKLRARLQLLTHKRLSSTRK